MGSGLIAANRPACQSLEVFFVVLGIFIIGIGKEKTRIA